MNTLDSTPNDPPVRLLAKYGQYFPATSPQLVLQAPERLMWAAASFNGKAQCVVRSGDLDAQTSFTYQSAKHKQTIYRRPLPSWARYIAGVSVLLDVPEMPGLNVVFCGDEPTGPRYDHALAILFAALWYDINMVDDYDPNALVEIAERVRREYVGG
ncbi:MAG TPA: hypothetical protein VHD90_25940 [Phototrophicaceae bacterium]|nr:hypothetical protein [Phototrophicaceae bacterium]